jgi:hypothetical protein
VSTAKDVDRLAAFNRQVHGAGVDTMARELILHHPDTRPEHWLFVQDSATGQVVSSLCLIPWNWRYGQVELKAGEAGLVGTLANYRRRGLVRAQMLRHAQLLQLGGFDLSHIQGIPYFYRQFGYEYALPLEADWRIEPYRIPSAPAGQVPPFRFREATLDDVATLERMYQRAAEGLDVSALRSTDTWRYLLGPSLHTEMAADTWLVTDPSEQPLGYFRIARHGFGEGLIVSEVSSLDSLTALEVLRHLKLLAAERGKPYIRLNVPPNCNLTQTARHLGARDEGSYAWQLRLPDVKTLLSKLGPIFERRVLESPFVGLTRNVSLSLYREAFALCFEEGNLVDVGSLGLAQRGDVLVPPLLAPALLFGHRSSEELASAHCDVIIKNDCQQLASVLFPRTNAFIYTIY